MFRIAAVAFVLALVHLPVSVSLAADSEVAISKKRVAAKQRYQHGCPDGYGCYPLYGAYGPYGGRAYWNSFSYIVPTSASRPSSARY
jgi:hypothetical protein